MNRYSRQAKPEVKKITSTRVSGRCRHTDEKAGAGGDFPESLLRRRSAAVWIESVLFAAPRSMAPITLGSCFERAITVSLARSRSRPTHRRQRCALGDPRAAGISYINFASRPIPPASWKQEPTAHPPTRFRAIHARRRRDSGTATWCDKKPCSETKSASLPIDLGQPAMPHFAQAGHRLSQAEGPPRRACGCAGRPHKPGWRVVRPSIAKRRPL
jgi:hypothetical protein